MKVVFLPCQAHSFAFGGFDMQMISIYEYLKNSGVDVIKFNPWDRETAIDIYHFWGLSITHFDNIQWAKKDGKKVIVSALLNPVENFKQRLIFNASLVFGNARIRKEITQNLDAIIVVNNNQKEIAKEIYEIPESKIFIIPHLIEHKYFENQKPDNNSTYSADKYILTTGNICRRKNQLNLAKACNLLKCNLILVGNILTGEEEYAKSLDDFIKGKPNLKWIKGLESASMELLEIYKNCFAYALPSFSETQPIGALEASVFLKPLLLANKKYAKQEYYLNACLVKENDINDIANGLTRIFSNPRNYVTPFNIIEKCKPQKIIDSYLNVYNTHI